MASIIGIIIAVILVAVGVYAIRDIRPPQFQAIPDRTFRPFPSGTQFGAPSSTPGDPNAPAGFTTAQLSPLYRAVRFFAVSPSRYGFVTVRHMGTTGGGVPLAGWQIRGNVVSTPLPKGIRGGTAFQESNEQWVIFGPGETYTIYAGERGKAQGAPPSEWIGWANNKFLDARHDKLVLLDQSGLVVDVYEY